MNTWKHHAYIIECDENLIQNVVDVVDSSFKINEKNLNISYFSFNTCGIEESREITSASIKTSLGGQSDRLFCISAKSITNEAQNALLKFFEEPILGLKILLFLPRNYPVLQTLRSRVEFINQENYSSYGIEVGVDKSYIANKEEKKNQLINDATIKDFYAKMSIKDRIKYVDDIAEAVSDEKITKSDVSKFLKEIGRQIQSEIRQSVRENKGKGASVHIENNSQNASKSNLINNKSSYSNNSNNFNNNPNNSNTSKSILRKAKAIMTAEEYLFDQSCSLKVLLERVAMA